MGNGCTDALECEFQNDYPVFLMQLYRDIGYISQEQYETVDEECRDQGAELTQKCMQLIDEVGLD